MLRYILLTALIVFSFIACKEEPANTLGLDGNASATLFDQLIADDANKDNGYKVPYPFEELVKYLSKWGDPVQVLVPLGRSLQRHKHGGEPFADPRRLVAFARKNYEKNSKGKEEVPEFDLHGRLFIGYVKHANQLEVISLLPGQSEFSFQTVEGYDADYDDNETTNTSVARPSENKELCASCHINLGPIFTPDAWAETNANNAIIALLRDHDTDEDGKIDGINIQNNPNAVENNFCLKEFKDSIRNERVAESKEGKFPVNDAASLEVISRCFDVLVREGNGLATAQYLWSVACAGETALECRKSIVRSIGGLSSSGKFIDLRGRKFYTDQIPDRLIADVFVKGEIIKDKEGNRFLSILKNGLADYNVSDDALAVYKHLQTADEGNMSVEDHSFSLQRNFIRGVEIATDTDGKVPLPLIHPNPIDAEKMATVRAELARMLKHAHAKNIHIADPDKDPVDDTDKDPATTSRAEISPLLVMSRELNSVIDSIVVGSADTGIMNHPLFPRLKDNNTHYAEGDKLYKSWLDTTPFIFSVTSEGGSLRAVFNYPADRSERVSIAITDHCNTSDDNFLRCEFSEDNFSFTSSETNEPITIAGKSISEFSFKLVASKKPHEFKSYPSLLSVTTADTSGEVTYEVDLSCRPMSSPGSESGTVIPTTSYVCSSSNLYLMHEIVDELASDERSILHKDEYNSRLLAQEILDVALGPGVVKLVPDDTDWTKDLALDTNNSGFKPPEEEGTLTLLAYELYTHCSGCHATTQQGSLRQNQASSHNFMWASNREDFCWQLNGRKSDIRDALTTKQETNASRKDRIAKGEVIPEAIPIMPLGRINELEGDTFQTERDCLINALDSTTDDLCQVDYQPCPDSKESTADP